MHLRPEVQVALAAHPLQADRVAPRAVHQGDRVVLLPAVHQVDQVVLPLPVHRVARVVHRLMVVQHRIALLAPIALYLAVVHPILNFVNPAVMMY